MDTLIGAVAATLILAYVGVAIWIICKQHTIARSIGVSAGLLCGGFVIIPVAEAVATFLCWAVVVAIILAILGAFSG